MAEKKIAETASEASSELVEIRIPKSRNGTDCIRVSMNDRPQFTIKRGVTVKVPRWVAEIVDNSELAEEAADAYISTLVTPT